MPEIICSDGFVLAGEVYEAASAQKNNRVLIINSATAVSRQLYLHFALFMAANGYEVITYDYRGIAASRPERLRGFSTSFMEWGTTDFPAVLDYAQKTFPTHRIFVLGHSIGGTIIGFTSRCSAIEGIINIGAQTAYYKDWDKKQRTKIYMLWHLFFPFITQLIGYFPGKRLGLLEDVPKGVIQQWHARRKEPDMIGQMKKQGISVYYDQYQGPLLTLGVADDPIGTEVAIRRIHKLFEAAEKELAMISLAEVPTEEIGHFGFFKRQFKETLWQRVLEWLEDQRD